MKKLILLILSISSLFVQLSIAQPCPPPGTGPGGDDCASATPICDPVNGINGYCDVLDANDNPSGFPGCPNNVLNNDEWFSFVASQNSVTITITPSNCQNQGGNPGMQGALYEGSCGGGVVATQCNCTEAPFILSGATTPGLTYYVVLDGCAGDICDYTVDEPGGATIPVPPPDVVPDGPISVCPGISTNYVLNELLTGVPIPNGDIYDWTISDPSVGTFLTVPPTGASLDIDWIMEGMVEICATGTNICNLSSSMPPLQCLTINVEYPPDVPDMIEGCPFDIVECPAAPGVSVQIGLVPSIETILQFDPVSGCQYNVVCEVNPIIVDPIDLGQIELCGPASYEMCAGLFKDNTGIYIEQCDDPISGCPGEVLLDLAVFEPEAIIATPIPELDCDPSSTVMLNGSNSTLFSPAPGATVVLNWTGPGLVGPLPHDDPIVTVDEPGEYCLTVTMARNGNECIATQCVTVIENTNLPNGPTLTGEDEPCEGDTFQYDADAVGTPIPTDYGWVTPNGEPFTIVDNNSIEIDWTGSIGGNLCVFGISPCGNGDTTCILITIGEAPNIPDVSGEVNVCAVNQQDTFIILNPQSGVTYSWTVPNGASFNGSGDTIMVNFDGADLGPGQVCATAASSNGCGSSDEGCFNVNVAGPPPIPAMTGPMTVCSNGTGYSYTVSNGQIDDDYNWSVPTGATVIGSGATVEVDFNGSQTGPVCVSITNECDTSVETCVTVTVQQVPVATISGSGALCEGVMEDVDLTISLTGVGPWDVEYTIDGSDTTMINVLSSPHTLTVNQPGVYELISLSGNGGCAGSVMGQAIIEENPLPTAVLSGMDNICENSNELGELTIVLTGTAPWTVNWESDMVAQAPLVINSSPYTMNITESQAGAITLTGVTDDNDCVGNPSGSGTVTVIQAPTVSMVERVCDATNTSYTVTIVIAGGDPTSYSVTPANGMLLGSTFTSNPILSSLNYSFTISDINDCDPVLVEGSFECDCETMAGDMDLTPIEFCGDGPISGDYDNTDEFLDGDDVLNFLLHNGNGSSIVNPVVGTYTSPDDISFDPGSMMYGETYYLSAVVANDNGLGELDLTDPCISVSLGTPITFFEIPAAILSGTDAVCEGENGNLTVTFTGEAPWDISYDDGTGVQTVTGITTNPYILVVSPSSPGINTFCLTDMTDNNCPGISSGCGDVGVNTGVEFDGLMVSCNSTGTGFVFMFNITGGDPSSYTVTGAPGSIINGVFTSDEISSPTGMGVGFSVVVDDVNGCDPQTVSQTEVICDCTSDAGEMDAMEVETCGDGPITVPVATNSVLDGDDLLLYYLHTGANNSLVGTIASNTDPTFSFDQSSMVYGTTYYVSSVVGSMDGSGGIDLMDQCLSVAVGTPVVFNEIPTATISGGTEICPGDFADLQIDLTGDSPWSIIVNGQVYNNINGSPFTLQVNPDATTIFQLTNVSSDNGCDNSIMDEQTVTVHEPPTVALDSEDCNNTGTAYTVCFTISGGDAAGYQVTPNTGTLAGSQFCSDLIDNGDGYSFSVTDGHGCPAAIISSPMYSCDCPTVAGDFVSMPLSVCSNEMTPALINYDDTNEILDPDDVLCYVLYNGTVALNTNPLEPVFGFNVGNMVLGQVYTICPVAGNDDGSGCVDFNDPCVSIGGCVEVVFNPLPTAILSGTTSICQGETADLTVNLTGTGPWELTYQNSAGVASTVTATSSPYTLMVSPTNSTVISLTNVVDGNGCMNSISSNTATVNVTLPPTVSTPIEDCNVLETEFTVSFNISGGGASAVYTVDPPGTLVGNTYTSDPIPTNSTYDFLVFVNGCGPTIVEGDHACNCFTQVGSMSNSSVSVCGDDLTTGALYDDTNQLLDPDDVLIFILQAVNTTMINPVNILAINPSDPIFGFDASTMQYGVTYYIAAVVGNSDGAGSIDFAGDFCDAASNNVPVVFYPLPSISVTGPAAICEGDLATLNFTLTGTAPFTINYLLNNIPAPSAVIQPNAPPELVVPIPVTSTITLVSIEDANCSNQASQSITITVNPNVEAGSPSAPLNFCENVNQTVVLFDQLLGADIGGTWTTQSGQPIPNGSLNVGSLVPGINTFTYTVSGLAPCPDDMAQIEIDITESPVADAGPDLFLNCDITEVTLGIGNTTPGANIIWSGPGISVPDDPNPVVSNSGTFTLSANIGNCTDTDFMQVEENITTPQANLMANPVSCFGETDGFVLVESVEGGEPPYLFSLNGGPFLAQQSFLGLAPGTYTIIVEDNVGCSSPAEFVIEEPVEVTVEIASNISGDPVIPLGESVTLTAITTPGFSTLDTIVWSPAGIDSLCMGCPQISVSPTQQTAYSVAVNLNGCQDDALYTVFISKDRPVYVPNAFSPNDDKINDILHVYGGASVAEVKSFLVFNRWGEAVYEYYNFQPAPREYVIGWDGKLRGEFMNPGVFVWFAEIEFTDGSTGLYEGDVTLLRSK